MKFKLIFSLICVSILSMAQTPTDTTHKPSPEQLQLRNSIGYILKNYKNDITEIKNYISNVSKSNDRISASNQMITESNQRLWSTIGRLEVNQKRAVDIAIENEKRAQLSEAKNRINSENERKATQVNNRVVLGSLIGIAFFLLLSTAVNIFLNRGNAKGNLGLHR